MDTTHMGTMGFWSQMPLPVAELGVDLDPRGTKYLDQWLRVLDAGLRVGLAIGLARARQIGAQSALCKSLLPFLVKPSLGKRADAIAVLEAAVPGSTGWNLEERADELIELAEALEGRRRKRAPKLHESLEQLARVRNDEKHWALTSQREAKVRGALEAAVFCVLRSNAELVRGHMLILRSMARLRPGEKFECEAWSLRGAKCVVLQNSEPLRFPEHVNPILGRVYWRYGDGTLLPLAPYIVARPPLQNGRELPLDHGVYLLDSIDRRAVIRRRPRTNESFEPGDDEELDASLPGWRNAYAQAGELPAASEAPDSSGRVQSSGSQSAWEVAEVDAPIAAGVPSEPPVLLPRPRCRCRGWRQPSARSFSRRPR